MHLLPNGFLLRIWGWFLIAAASLLFSFQPSLHAATAEAKFYAAQRSTNQLKKNPSHQKYRHHWLKCINGFLAVYRHDPHGPWAAAGLYNAGELYYGLYKRSYLYADKQEALNLLQQVRDHYTKSRYKPRAQALLSEIRGRGTKKTAVKSGLTADQWYQKAQAKYRRIQKSVGLQKRRDQWMACIRYYRNAYEADPQGNLAPQALKGMADSYGGLFKWSGSLQDQQAAQRALRQLASEFPESTASAREEQQKTVADPTPSTRIAEVIEQSTAGQRFVYPDYSTATSTRPAVVEGLRFWSNPRYTRVVIDATQNTGFAYNELHEDPSNGKPQRIYVDVQNSRLSADLQKVVPINDDLLRDARAAQYRPDTVRVVVDIKSAKTYKIFPLKNPFRIVLDVWGYEAGEQLAVYNPPARSHQPSSSLPPSDIVRQLALGVRRVVIDPGHGGKDYGAPGYYKGVHEKDIVLAIGKRLAQMVRSELKCEAILTRSSDVFISLEERTAIANTQNADLFISIHTNASPEKRAYGIETFILNLATDDEAIRVAAIENATSMKNISDLDSILKDLMQNAKVNESTRLATYVQQSAYNRLKGKYSPTRNKGVKKAPFYVLLGADMPSILIETAFISNPRDCKRLTTSAYQETLCRGILEGIKRYMDETNPIAAWSPVSGRAAGDGG